MHSVCTAVYIGFFFFLKDPPPPEFYPFSLHAALPFYIWAFNDSQFRQSIFNNLLWLAVVPAACTLMGLVIAALTDRIWWGNVAKSFIFMPLAISFVGARSEEHTSELQSRLHLLCRLLL